ncbi:NAD(P)/FAD-dependent oxidoreductase [Tistrella mobilis]|uniref:NAD(P)/FAD-dependent oxidoreductase n=1 Tax=Tistrella mobilis TaxID=171437 RepID=UPI000AE7F865|nr:NAD(P)/FAD-dependent oxidoreductase [Tistrella mobilis]
MTATSTTFDPAAYGIAPGAAGDIVATQPGGRHETDIAVIGAGPVGLFSVFEAGMLKLKTHVVDALPHVGGQCSAMYPEKPIYDIPGWPKIEAQALIDQLAAQAAPFDPAWHLGQQVTDLSRDEASGDWIVGTDKGTQIQAKAVLIAAGVGAFGPNRPPLAGIEAYEEHSVFYRVARKEAFRGKRVVIAGGGDSALDWAIELADITAAIMVIHRRPKFRGAPESVAKLHALAAQGKIELVVPYQLHGLEGDPETGRLDAVTVADLDGNVRRLEADVLLPFFGLSMNLGPILTWGLALDQNHITVEQATMSTSLPGIFAIGDIARYPHKLKLILSGFAEAASATHAAREICRPGEVMHFEYSTTKGVPGA